DKKGFVVGLTLLGFGLSPFITAPLAGKLIGLYGPLSTFKIMGLAFGIIITLLALPLRFPDRESFRGGEGDVSSIRALKTGEMLKTPVFYGLWGCYVIGTLIGLMAIAISSPVAEEVVRLSPGRAAMLVSLFAVFNGLGRPLFGWLTDEFSPARAAQISYILVILASVLMLTVGEGSILLFAVSFSLLWLNLGGWLAIAPTATGIYFGAQNYSKNYGYVFTAYGVGAILGTLLSGRVRDLLGSYIYAFYPTILLAIAGLIISHFLLQRPAE
ncbi:MAG: MFS transporter, partial [Halanaerobiales bacterium]